MSPVSVNPLILTLEIEEQVASYFNELRRIHFPPNLNFLESHLTLFHYLPFSVDDALLQLNKIANGHQAFSVQLADVVSIGKGVAFKMESKDLQTIHKHLQQTWKPFLKPQDVQKLWPHITIQNKVSPQQSKETLALLKQDFHPFSFMGTGLLLWEYLGGPWKLLEKIPFKT